MRNENVFVFRAEPVEVGYPGAPAEALNTRNALKEGWMKDYRGPGIPQVLMYPQRSGDGDIFFVVEKRII